MTEPPAGDTLIPIVEAAARAPSSHNTQPWLFGIDGNRINLYADRDRALPANDPDDRELIISCGCALLNLRVAAEAAGYDAAADLFPDAGNRDLLATIELVAASPDRQASALAGEIPKRRTFRKAFRDEVIPADVVADLRNAARLEGAWLEIVDDENTRREVARLVGDGDAVQWSSGAWRRELAGWIRPASHGDGLSVPAVVAPVARFAVRNLDMGRFIGKHDRELAEKAPLLAVLGTDRDERTDWLRAGQALERMLLEASRNGIQASYLNQPIQVADLRPELERCARLSGAAQLLVRLGYPEGDIDAAPRRDPDAIVTN